MVEEKAGRGVGFILRDYGDSQWSAASRLTAEDTEERGGKQEIILISSAFLCVLCGENFFGLSYSRSQIMAIP